MSTLEAGPVVAAPAPPSPLGSSGGGTGGEAAPPQHGMDAISCSSGTKKKPQEPTSNYSISLFLSTIRLGWHGYHILSILSPVGLLGPEFQTTPRDSE